MQIVDIVLLVGTLVVAVLLYMRLGRRTGFEKSPLSYVKAFQKKDVSNLATGTIIDVDIPLITGIKQVQAVDPKFTQESFLTEMKGNFEVIIRSFVQGAKDTLHPLLVPSLYKLYEKEMNSLKKQELLGELDFFRLVEATIQDISVAEGIAKIKVHFVSDQTQLRKDKSGTVVEGDPNAIDRINEVWVVEKNLGAKETAWKLAEILPYEAA
jgi:predicted lipid-binding transport protein (Tim44 family)